MVEPVSFGAGYVAGKAGKAGLVSRALGPPADAVGEMLTNMVERRRHNAERIVEAAHRKLGDKADDPGEVPFRVAGRLLQDGSYCEDDVAVEYLGGVLASSRTGAGRDDRGASWTSLVTQLSVYDLRLHFVLYRDLQPKLASLEQPPSFSNAKEIHRFVYVADIEQVCAAMDFGPGEEYRVNIVGEALVNLHRHGLLQDYFLLDADGLATSRKRVTSHEGVVGFTPCLMGVTLFLYAHGLGGQPSQRYLDAEFETGSLTIPLVEFALLSDLPTPDQAGNVQSG